MLGAVFSNAAGAVLVYLGFNPGILPPDAATNPSIIRQICSGNLLSPSQLPPISAELAPAAEPPSVVEEPQPTSPIETVPALPPQEPVIVPGSFLSVLHQTTLTASLTQS